MEIRELVKRAFKRDLSDPSALSDAFDTLRLLEPEDFTLAHERNKEVRRLSARFAAEQKSLRMFELNKRSLLFDAPYDFDAAIRYAEWDREPKKKFYMPRRKQLLPVVQAMFQNCELEDGQYKELAKGGMAITIKSVQAGMEAKVYRIASELNQTNTQTIVDDLEDAYLTICGMPNRNGGSSTSDTGQAVIYRDGWSAAESRAKDTEKTWERSEREFLRLVLYICRETGDLDLQLADIKPEFTRKNLSNIQSKAQVLAEMLNNSKIHPKLAFQYSGLFSDPESAYRVSMDWYEEQKRKMERSLRDELNTNRDTNITAEERNNDVSVSE